MKIGQFLIQSGHITGAQLDEALRTQENEKPHRLLGEILVSAGYLDKRALFHQLMAFVRERSEETAALHEWISQAEIDALLAEGPAPE